MSIPNVPHAEDLLRREYRKGLVNSIDVTRSATDSQLQTQMSNDMNLNLNCQWPCWPGWKRVSPDRFAMTLLIALIPFTARADSITMDFRRLPPRSYAPNSRLTRRMSASAR